MYYNCKKTLFICPVFPPYKSGGGQSQVAGDYAKGLKDKGQNITVVTTQFDGLKEHEEMDGINVIRFSSISKFLLNCGLYNPEGIYKWLKNNLKDYDFVFIHDIYTLYGFIVAKFCRKYNIPYILMPHGVGNISKQKEKVLFKRIFVFLFSAFVSNNAKEVIFCSENEKRDYELPYKHGVVITNGINQKGWIKNLEKITKDDIQIFRQKYSLGNKKIIFSMGRLSYGKRFDKVINYLSEFLKKNSDYILLIVGPDGGELNNLKKLIEENRLYENVKIIEGLFGKEKSIIFKISSLFILASDHEGFPIVVCEAISSKLPCLISNECNISGLDGFVEVFTNRNEFLDCFYKLIYGKLNIQEEYLSSFDINNSIIKLNDIIQRN